MCTHTHPANLWNYDKIFSLSIVTVYSFNCTHVAGKGSVVSLWYTEAVTDLLFVVQKKIIAFQIQFTFVAVQRMLQVFACVIQIY